MLFSKIKKFFNLERTLLFLLSAASAINTYLFLYLKIYKTNLFEFVGIGKISFFYVFIVLFFLITLVYILKNPRGATGKFLLVFLPMELVLIYGYLFNEIKYDTSVFTYTLRPFIGIYLLIAGFLFIFKYKKYSRIGDFFRGFGKNKDKTETKKSARKQNFLKFLLIIPVIVFNLVFGMYHLSEFAAVDEPLWTDSDGRIYKFWNNVNDGEIYKTMVSDKPGITVALISGVALNWIHPAYYKNSHVNQELSEDFLDIKELNFAFRFPIILFNSLMLAAFYFLLKKLLGSNSALIAAALIGLSPLLLGISTIVNPDSLLWTFAPLSLIAYLAYLKDRENKYLYWSGILLGLALLTKYVANVLYVFFFALIFLEYIFNSQKYKDKSLSAYFKKSFFDYLTLVFFSLATFFIFLPAAWVDLSRVLEGTILSKAFLSVWPLFLGIIALLLFDILVLKNKIAAPAAAFLSKYKKFFVLAINLVFAVFVVLTLADTYFGMKFYDLESILASPKSSKTFSDFLGLGLSNFYSLIFGLIPLSFFAMFFTNLKNIFQKRTAEISIWSTYLILFIVIYYLASVMEGVSATVRYQIILYPLAMVLSAIGIRQIANIRPVKKYAKLVFVYPLVLIISLYSLNSIKPFYFSYASDLLPKKYVLNLKDMGDGSYEAAQYLNRLPDAEILSVWTDKRGVCAFFVGICKSGFDFDGTEKFDYFVVSSGRESRTSKMTVGKIMAGDKISEAINNFYSQDIYDYKLVIGGRPNNFVKIISGKKLLGD